MNDIPLLETCESCGENLRLMPSRQTYNGKLYLVKRCLKCMGSPVVEIVQIVEEES